MPPMVSDETANDPEGSGNTDRPMNRTDVTDGAPVMGYCMMDVPGCWDDTSSRVTHVTPSAVPMSTKSFELVATASVAGMTLSGK